MTSQIEPVASRGQLAATFLVVLGSVAALTAVRFSPGGFPLPAEIELLLAFVILGGVLLLGLDARRHRQSAPAAPVPRTPAPRRAAEAPPRVVSSVRPVPIELRRVATERAPAENGNRAALALLQGIVAHVPVGIVACDPNGALTIFNRVARELHGVPGEAPLSRPLGEYYELYARDGLTRLAPEEEPLSRALRGETLVGEEMMVASRSGFARTVTVNAQPQLDANGLLLGAIMTLEDVTERQRTEQDLRAELERARESDRLKSSFLANMSHEIRTPLNIILGYNTMIADYFTDSGDTSQQPLLDAIGRASRRLMNTVHGILDISRIEVGAFEIHPIALKPADEIQRTLLDYEDVARDKSLELVAEIDEPGAVILCDEHCFRRALEHLVDNAIKFTSAGSIRVCLFRDSERILNLEVRDTGVGIDPEYIPHLFQAFSQEESGYTRRFEGSGLGLALVKSYVEFNHADVFVESRKGEGSTFRIRFFKEVGQRPNAQEEIVQESPKPPAGGERPVMPIVLVVEDDTETQGYMRALLGRRYEVLLAASGEEARRHLADSGEKIRAILMDLSLKGDEDGLMLTRSLRQHPRWKDVPIVATTAHAFLEDQNRALAAGCDAFLAKPFGREELFETLERLLR